MTTPTPATDLTLGDRYDVIAPVGRGAAAQVYRVRDRWSGSERAAKVLLPESVKSEQTLRRFEDEYRILRGLHHPSLPEVHDYGWVGTESRFMIMELVDGEPLDQYFKAHPEDLWIIIYQLCEVLSFIHDHNLLHQDIKPSNILVRRTTAFGEEMPLVTLLDFGLTFRRDGERRGGMVGTPAYMAPEVIRGETPLTRAVDYYSLGATLFELITGEVPFKGTTREVLGAHLEDIPRAPREKIEYAELYPLVYGLMAKDKNERMEVFGKVRVGLTTRLPESTQTFRREISVAIAGAACRLGSFSNSDDGNRSSERVAVTVVLGAPGTGKTSVAQEIVAEAAIAGRKVIEVVSTDGAGNNEITRERAIEVWAEAISSSDASGVLIWADLSSGQVDEPLLESLVERAELLATEADTSDVALLVCTTMRGVLARLSSVTPWSIELGPVGGEQRKAILKRLRPVAHKEDARHLERLLTNSSISISRLSDAIRFNIREGNVTFEAGQWHISAAAIVPEEKAAASDYYATTLQELHKDSREMVRWVCCQDIEVPLVVLSRVSGASVEEVHAALSSAVDRGVVELIGADGRSAARATTPRIREAIYESLADDDAAFRHKELVDASRQCEGVVSEVWFLRFIAAQYASLGDYREMARCYLIAVRRGMIDADFERDVLSECFHRLRASRSHQMIARYCVKRLSRIHADVSNFVGVRQVLDEYVDTYGVPLPDTFLLTYIFSLYKSSDTAGMKRLLSRAAESDVPDFSEHGLRLRVCKANVARQEGRYREAMDLVRPVLESPGKTSAFERAHALVLVTTCVTNLGDAAAMETYTKETLAVCEAHGFHDLFVITLSNWAAVLVDAGRYREAVRAVAIAMRVAGRHKLHDRQYDLASKSSLIYYEMGDFERALRWIEKARMIAQTLGDRSRVVQTTIQIGMNLQMMGRHHDAIRFARSAMALIRPDVTLHIRSRVAVFLADALLSAFSEGAEGAHRAMMEMLPGMDGLTDSAYARSVDGRYLESVGATEDALESYRYARRTYDKVGFLDDKTRVSIRIARILLKKREYKAFVQLMSEIRENVARMESANILGGASAVRILGCLAMSDLKGLSAAVEEARHVQPTDVTARLELSRTVALAGMELGEVEVVKEAASSFYADTKTVVARMGEADASRYLQRSGATEFMARYSEWSRNV